MSNLNRAERLVCRLLNESESLNELCQKFQEAVNQTDFDKLSPEYQQAWKRGINLWEERRRNIKYERGQSANWRDQYLTGKAKRH